MTTAVATPPRHFGPASAVRHGTVLAWRGVLKIRKNPEQLLDVTLQPILFLVLFGYLFGGAVAGNTGAYLETLAPGLMVQVILMASMATGVALNTDVSKGVFDRFRSMPIARSAPLLGAVLADVVRYVVALVVLLLMAMVMGFRLHASPAGLVVAVAVLVLAGLCFCWITVFVGMLVPTPASLQGVMVALMLPLTFGSNVFVPNATMPGWLRAWSEISPVSLLSDATRGLLVGGEVAGPLTGGLVWMAGVAVVFFPLAMRAYRRRMG
ncbi:ABC transporter permease [Amycolatopsis cynarae]|uniref:Transport permease protein n=1 Tax=Amycolatopsis cynarae TaxID=2995223 RepID=A0ABY7B361_9PSEU|nr:ABC transporter permease [Amycolatopsis sp. HUAS 11-8]WAL66123.1 ABC transporter permease [Amycolatopsis sp. HUAS 11-8]